jgi:hypothetical protein
MRLFAQVLREFGDLQGAHVLHEQTLAARQRILGEDHPDTLASMSSLEAVDHELREL